MGRHSATVEDESPTKGWDDLYQWDEEAFVDIEELEKADEEEYTQQRSAKVGRHSHDNPNRNGSLDRQEVSLSANQKKKKGIRTSANQKAEKSDWVVEKFYKGIQGVKGESVRDILYGDKGVEWSEESRVGKLGEAVQAVDKAVTGGDRDTEVTAVYKKLPIEVEKAGEARSVKSQNKGRGILERTVESEKDFVERFLSDEGSLEKYQVKGERVVPQPKRDGKYYAESVVSILSVYAVAIAWVALGGYTWLAKYFMKLQYYWSGIENFGGYIVYAGRVFLPYGASWVLWMMLVKAYKEREIKGVAGGYGRWSVEGLAWIPIIGYWLGVAGSKIMGGSAESIINYPTADKRFIAEGSLVLFIGLTVLAGCLTALIVRWKEVVERTESRKHTPKRKKRSK